MKPIDTLTIKLKNIADLSEDEYALARKDTIGASDISVILGLQKKWKTKSELKAEKRNKTVTEADRAIGLKDVVRKGKILEPLIIQTSSEVLKVPIEKPKDMYVITDYPYLSVNYDGVATIDNTLIPVECKYVSPYGDKYYTREEASFRYLVGTDTIETKENIIDLIDTGIPPYYYAQLQQQILGLNAPYGYLAALHDKNFELCLYKVLRSDFFIRRIITEGYQFYREMN